MHLELKGLKTRKTEKVSEELKGTLARMELKGPKAEKGFQDPQGSQGLQGEVGAAGAQGPHKISRGYLPSETYSAHWICDPTFRQAIAKFLTGEEKETEWEMGMLEKERSPYRKEVAI